MALVFQLACGAAVGGTAAVRLEPLPQQADHRPTTLGELDLMGAFELRSDDPLMGGLSGLARQGDRYLFLSDRGRLFSATGSGDRLEALAEWRSFRLPARNGREPDSEALTLRPDGTLVIACESGEGLAPLAFDGEALAPLEERLPAVLADAPMNEGIEALAALPDGRLLALSEGLWRGEGKLAAALIDGADVQPRTYVTRPGFQPTDAAAAGTWLFVLERRLSFLGGLESRIVALPLKALAERELEGRELARLGPASVQENFEGLAVEALGQRRYRLLIVSDDNFIALQRTLLLELGWDAPDPRAIRD